jgi:hypothetical protein
LPEPGFKSVTVSDITYDRFYKWYQLLKLDYQRRGINSFSAFCTYKLAEAHKDKNHAVKCRFTTIALEDLAHENIIVLKDTWYNELAEVHIDDSSLFCVTCNKEFCIHTGFCYSLPQSYQIAKKVR